MPYGEHGAGPAAHGLRNQNYFFDLELVENFFKVIGEARSVRAAVEVARVAEATVIECDYFEPTGKKRHLIEPRRVVATHAVGKNKRRSIPKDFIINFCHVAAFFV